MEYYTADSYKNYIRIGKPYTKNGKLYSTAKCKCDRCTNGIYAVGVENGHIKPHPAYNGVCLKCGGSGFIKKEIRLYTKSEYDRMTKNAENAKLKKEIARKKEIEENFEKNKINWIENHGFSSDGFTYIVTGDSYSIKEELKKDGFKFDSVLRWHRSTPDNYEDKVIKVKLEDVIEFSAWGEGHYITGAYDKIESLINNQTSSASEYVGEIGKKIIPTIVNLIKTGCFSGKFGLTNIFTFEDENKCIYTWFTSTNQNIQVGDKIILQGTVKKHEEYKGVKSTVLTRCHISKAE